jgi:hypothetical protein
MYSIHSSKRSVRYLLLLKTIMILRRLEEDDDVLLFVAYKDIEIILP